LVACKSPIRVKLADFGLAKSIDGTQLRSIVGTPNYQAPGLFNLLPPTLRTSKQSEFTTAVDMWSLECLVHKILSLETLFLTEEDETVPSEFVINSGELEKCIDTHILSEFCCGRIDFPKNRLKASKAPESAIDFIQKLLVPDPNRRMTASEALQHRWLSKDCLKQTRAWPELPYRAVNSVLRRLLSPPPVRRGSPRSVDTYLNQPGLWLIVEMLEDLMKEFLRCSCSASAGICGLNQMFRSQLCSLGVNIGSRTADNLVEAYNNRWAESNRIYL
jgi:serine/threonine protein kinase